MLTLEGDRLALVRNRVSHSRAGLRPGYCLGRGRQAVVKLILELGRRRGSACLPQDANRHNSDSVGETHLEQSFSACHDTTSQQCILRSARVDGRIACYYDVGPVCDATTSRQRSLSQQLQKKPTPAVTEPSRREEK